MPARNAGLRPAPPAGNERVRPTGFGGLRNRDPAFRRPPEHARELLPDGPRGRDGYRAGDPRAKPAWAVEIKYGSPPRLTRGFHTACDDLQPEHAFVVHSGDRRYPIRPGITAISLAGLANRLASGGDGPAGGMEEDRQGA